MCFLGLCFSPQTLSSFFSGHLNPARLFKLTFLISCKHELLLVVPDYSCSHRFPWGSPGPLHLHLAVRVSLRTHLCRIVCCILQRFLRQVLKIITTNYWVQTTWQVSSIMHTLHLIFARTPRGNCAFFQIKLLKLVMMSPVVQPGFKTGSAFYQSFVFISQLEKSFLPLKVFTIQ